MKAYIARQPILDRDRSVYGYEVLFRSSPENFFSAINGDQASAQVLGDVLHVHDLTALTGGRPCFINVTSQILVDELYATLPPDRIVLELLESIEPDDEFVAACRRARRAGYTLALDDYVLQQKFDCLLPIVQMVKADFMQIDDSQRKEVVAVAKHHKLTLLAEKIENHAEFHNGCELGYEYFQGFFFSKPEMIANRRIPSSGLMSVQLLSQINQPELDLDELESLIRKDTALSYRLMRFLNSAAFSFRSEITSIRHGLNLLGDRPLKRWVSLMVLSQLGSSKPVELLTLSLVRGRFCEEAGKLIKPADGDPDLFLLGMFSVLDAILDSPMEDLLKHIALCDQLRAALIGEDSRLCTLLKIATCSEQGDWETIESLARSINVSVDRLADAYQRAIVWAAEVSKMLKPVAPEQAAQAA